jgi:hypothetical protein
VGDSFVVQPNLKKNGFPSDDEVSFKPAGSIIAVDNEGVVTLAGYGEGTVQMYVSNNTSASAMINIEVVSGAIPEYELRITPPELFVYERDSKTFKVDAYFRGIVQSMPFNLSVDVSGSIVPSSNYKFEYLGGNQFEIENLKKFLSYPLIVNAESGSLQRNIEIDLKGSW